MDILDIIAQLQSLDVNNSGIRAALKKKGFTQEEIEDALPTTARRTFATDFYDWLAEEPRSEEETEAYILAEENSKNVKKHLSHYTNIANLAQRIWEAK